MYTAAQLVELVEQRLGIKGDSAVADALKLGRFGHQSVKRWRTGAGDPEFAQGIRMLELAGLLRPPGEVGGSGDARVPVDRDAALVESVVRTAELLEQAVVDLRALLPAELLGEDDRARRRGGRAA